MTNGEINIGLVTEIEQLLFDVTTQHQSNIEAEKQWLLSNCTNLEMARIVGNLTVTAFHTLDAIGHFQPVNSIDITKKTGIPKGTVSKNIKKLIDNNLITKVPLSNNKKESILNLTPLGKELFDLHGILHKKLNLGLTSFLNQYEAHELQFIAQFLKDFRGLSWIDL